MNDDIIAIADDNRQKALRVIAMVSAMAACASAAAPTPLR